MAFYKTPTLETERLILRQIQVEDIGAMQLLFNDWEVVKYFAASALTWPIADDNYYQYYKNDLFPQMQAGTDISWVIALRSTNQLIGSLHITPDDQEDTRGFWLGSAHHRHGYMTEAVIASTDYFFNELNKQKMILNNADINTASRRIKEKANAEFLGITPNHEFVCGAFPQENWLLTAQRWRDSPIKRAAANPSYKIIS